MSPVESISVPALARWVKIQVAFKAKQLTTAAVNCEIEIRNTDSIPFGLKLQDPDKIHKWVLAIQPFVPHVFEAGVDQFAGKFVVVDELEQRSDVHLFFWQPCSQDRVQLPFELNQIQFIKILP